jgi:hypothetical protein
MNKHGKQKESLGIWSTARRRSRHLHAQMFPHPLVDVVGDRDGGRHLAKVGQDAAVETADALGAQDVAEQTDRVRLLGGQVQIQTG